MARKDSESRAKNDMHLTEVQGSDWGGRIPIFWVWADFLCRIQQSAFVGHFLQQLPAPALLS